MASLGHNELMCCRYRSLALNHWFPATGDVPVAEPEAKQSAPDKSPPPVTQDTSSSDKPATPPATTDTPEQQQVTIMETDDTEKKDDTSKDDAAKDNTSKDDTSKDDKTKDDTTKDTELNNVQGAADSNKSVEISAKPKPSTEVSPLEKYWNAVRDNPNDFTGWTYLLQYVEQEVRKITGLESRCNNVCLDLVSFLGKYTQVLLWCTCIPI